MHNSRTLRPVMPILIGAAVMLSLSMGIRQCFGLFLQPVTKDLAITISDFTLALSIQNLTWGFLQPFAGVLAVRFNYRTVLVGGALIYLAGLALLASAHGMLSILFGAGLFIGAALACTTSSTAQAVAARSVPASVRGMVLGVVTGVGSLGALVAAPLGQIFTDDFGWRAGMLALAALAIVMLPAAWFAGRDDRIDLPPAFGKQIDDVSASVAVRSALSNGRFMVMTAAFFVCGLQLLFITTHLPSYLEMCGLDPMLSVEALSVIAVANAFGSVFFGWAGGHWPKLVLLGSIYAARSLVMAWYFIAVPTPAHTLIFAALMGFLWLGVLPLVAGAVIEMFGLRWQAMLSGVAFMSHQLGSFLGAFGGGLLLETYGSYDFAWRFAVGLGLTAGVIQIASALARPPRLAIT
jgi:predicted MFS family arabinose efflux permease